jgi:hypothetical protein
MMPFRQVALHRIRHHRYRYLPLHRRYCPRDISAQARRQILQACESNRPPKCPNLLRHQELMKYEKLSESTKQPKLGSLYCFHLQIIVGLASQSFDLCSRFSLLVSLTHHLGHLILGSVQ